MKNLISLLLSIIVLIVIDYTIPTTFPLTSKDNYLLGFEKFYNTANETIGQDRIILVGGSSLGWGVSSKVLTENLGKLTLNSGIHAGVGYRNFFRNIEDVIDKDRDLIVISPEYSNVSLGKYLDRSDEFCFISIYVRKKYPLDCVGYSISSFAHISPILNRKRTITDRDEYIKNGFNRFGDYVHRIKGVNMVGKMHTEDICSGLNVEDLSEKYVPFIDGLISQGYEVVYIPNFIPIVACYDVDKLNEFQKLMFGKYGIQPFDEAELLFDEHYFYNSVYHLTEEGVDLKTSIFENQIRHYLNNK